MPATRSDSTNVVASPSAAALRDRSRALLRTMTAKARVDSRGAAPPADHPTRVQAPEADPHDRSPGAARWPRWGSPSRWSAAWQFWPCGADARRRRTQPESSGHGNGNGHGGHDGVVEPGRTRSSTSSSWSRRTAPSTTTSRPTRAPCGATTGRTLHVHERRVHPGARLQATKAPDIQPHDITHGFSSGLYAIDGGKMDGFNIIGVGRGHVGLRLLTTDRACPNYWAYADRFVLADHFFTSMYGPTFPEHLYAVAAQSYGIVDNKSTVDHPGSYCDDPTEYTPHFPRRAHRSGVKKIMGTRTTTRTTSRT